MAVSELASEKVALSTQVSRLQTPFLDKTMTTCLLKGVFYVLFV